MTEFLQMGGYAVFVWPSYALAALVLWLNWYLPRKRAGRTGVMAKLVSTAQAT